MAKLSAHGNELIRLEKEAGPSDYAERVRTSLAVMADGKILRKVDSWSRPSYNPAKLEQHSSGWKVYARLKTGISVDHYRETLIAQGWRAA